MYRAMIVEDEPLMRQYLAAKLNEIHPDWQAAAEASNGVEAMALLQKGLFDLVITDIRMAGMDGLSLARYVEASFPDTFVMILSGYDEFDYARTAVRLNVCDYLLKPLNDNELAEALGKVSKKIEEQKKRRQADSCFPALFRDVLGGAPDDSLAGYYPKLYGAPEIAGKEHWGIMVISPSLLDAAKLGGREKLWSIKRRLFDMAFHGFYGLGAMDGHGNTAVLLCVNDPLLLKTECLKNCQKLYQTFLKETGIRVSAGFSKPYHALDHMKKAYEEALPALWLAQTGDDAFVSGDLMYAQRMKSSRLQALADGFREALSQQDPQPYMDLCYQAASLLSFPASINAFAQLGAFLLARLTDSEEALLKGAARLLQASPDALMTASACAKAYHDCLSVLRNSGKALQEDGKPSFLIQKVQEYLHIHFQEGVSLSMVAEAFHVTPSYLSSLFHKEAGESYSKYLLRVRMEYAAMQLASNPSVRMYDVAKQAGFVSSKHFIHVFRNFYGKTPKEYQERSINPV